MTADLLLELFSEEIPARMQAKAQTDLASTLIDKVRDAGYEIKGLEWDSFSTPRRVAVTVRNLPTSQPGGIVELKGPKIGAPEQAIEGFLKKSGKKREELEERDGIYIAKTEQGGKATSDILKIIIEAILANFQWPKSMRWGTGNTTWVRPLHSILCVFDGKVIPVEFAGVKASNITYGHRFLAPAAITINNPNEYEAALEKAFVIANRSMRTVKIATHARETAEEKKFSIKTDQGLLEEVTGLVEWPTMLTGTIDSEFMDLPPELLIITMKSHQKYFALHNPVPNPQSLAPHFLITSNMQGWKDGGKAVIAGNERVLRARFSDAKFFWDHDRKKKLEEFAKGLSAVTYHAKLGSVADKVARIEKLAEALFSHCHSGGSRNPENKMDPGLRRDDVVRAAALCKADLLSGVVGEFPELQGLMGCYYAKHQGEPDAVAHAIRDHYKPLGPGDSVPTEPAAICVALADKLDTLISMFAIGEKPTGSKDPFALRRAALGVIRIILENNLRIALKPLLGNPPLVAIALNKAHDKLVSKTQEKLHDPDKVGKYLMVNEVSSSDIPEGTADKLAADLLAFFADRLKVQLKDQGISHDIVSAVLTGGDDDLVRITARAKALQDFVKTEDGTNLLAAYKRAANILGIEQKKDKVEYTAASLDDKALTGAEEKALLAQLDKEAPLAAKLIAEEKFADAMKLLSSWRKSIDSFFDKTMVNADDATLRKNRLSLLAKITTSINLVANFGLIEG